MIILTYTKPIEVVLPMYAYLILFNPPYSKM